MGHVVGQLLVFGLIFITATVGIHRVWLVGERKPRSDDLVQHLPGRRLEARLLAGLIAVVTVATVAALWVTWPTG